MSKKFEEIDVLRHEEGVISVVTKKEMRNGYQMVSFALMREFERKAGEPTQRTTFLNERHIDACHDLLERTRERIMKEKDIGAEYRRRAGTDG